MSVQYNELAAERLGGEQYTIEIMNSTSLHLTYASQSRVTEQGPSKKIEKLLPFLLFFVFRPAWKKIRFLITFLLFKSQNNLILLRSMSHTVPYAIVLSKYFDYLHVK